MMIKLSIYIILLVYIISGTVAIGGGGERANYLTTTFQFSDSCLFNTTTQTGGCNIFSSATFWDVPDALTGSANYTFLIDLRSTTDQIDLIVNDLTNIDVGSLIVYGGLSVKLSFNVSVFNVTSNVTFSAITLEMTNDTTIYADQVLIVNKTSAFLGHQSQINTFDFGTDNSVVIDADSVLALYDTSSLSSTSIVVQGNLNLHDSSQVVCQTMIANNTFSGVGTSIHAMNSITIMGTNTQLNGNTTGGLAMFADNTNVTFTGASFRFNNLLFGIMAEFYLVNGDGRTGSLTLPSTSSLCLINTDYTIYGANTMQIISGAILVESNTTLTITNSTVTSMFSESIKHNPSNSSTLSTITIAGAVSFVNPMKLNSNIIVLPNAEFGITQRLELYWGVDISGTVYLSDKLICNNGKVILRTPESMLSMDNNAILYVYMFDNNGTIDVNTMAQIYGNINCWGTINIQDGGALSVNGYIDLFESSLVNIGGIGPNTTYAALAVRDIIKLNGEFQFNVSTPPEYGISGYNLLSSQIELDGNFTTTTLDPSLDNYIFTLYQYRSSLQLVYVGLEEPRHKPPALAILLGVFLPLFAITIIFTILFYLYRRNKQYKFYTRIQ